MTERRVRFTATAQRHLDRERIVVVGEPRLPSTVRHRTRSRPQDSRAAAWSRHVLSASQRRGPPAPLLREAGLSPLLHVQRRGSCNPGVLGCASRTWTKAALDPLFRLCPPNVERSPVAAPRGASGRLVQRVLGRVPQLGPISWSPASVTAATRIGLVRTTPCLVHRCDRLRQVL